TPGQRVLLTQKGKAFIMAGSEERTALWRAQLLGLSLFRDIHTILQQRPSHLMDRDFVIETIITRMPYEDFEKIFNTFIRWSRFGGLFSYDQESQRLSL